MALDWQEAQGKNIWRAQIDGRTVASIVRQWEGDGAFITVATRYGGERSATVYGDNLDDNKRTARDMLQGEGFQF